MFTSKQKKAGVAGLVAGLAAGSASAATGTVADVQAMITQFQTDGVLIAGALTLAIFAVAAAKWLRRAK